MHQKQYFYFFSLILFLAGGSFLVMYFQNQAPSNREFIGNENLNVSSLINSAPSSSSNPESITPSEKTEISSPIIISQKIQQVVPFITQAPFANWQDPNFQNGCEEASIVMALAWTKDEKIISQDEAKKRILEIIAFENKTFGYSADTNIFDIEKIFRQYFRYDNVKTLENITLNDIKNELQKSNLVLVPAFGRALQNPNFTQPGPITHMLVIIGYDPVTKEIITNDPGTRNGKIYRYAENLIFSAIWSYPSGKEHPPIPLNEKMSKVMISVSK